MCGIIGVGIFGSSSGAPADVLASVRAGMGAMALRGPDGEGVYEAQGVVFGHRRLSVIDLDGGRQPFTDVGCGATIVYNGELYNYRELRGALQSAGHQFSTASDTEVLLRAYLEWGEGCLDRLVGMFAFAVHDPARGRLFIARDHTGIKPLFYSLTNTRVAFASSCAALRKLPGVGPAMYPAAASHYLSTLRTTLGERTLYRDIRTLLPGTCLSVGLRDGKAGVRRYWEIPVVAEADKPDVTEADAAAQVREFVENAVRSQLVSDVPLGGFLSGGVDSTVLGAVARRMTDGHFRALSVGYDRDGFNEWEYSREAAAHLGVPCREVHLDGSEYAGTWRNLVALNGLPALTPNEIPIHLLAKAFREEFTVALSGEGADEVFGGYVIPCFSAVDYERAAETGARGRPHAEAIEWALRRLYGRSSFQCRPDHYFLTNMWMPFDGKRRLLSPGFWSLLDNDAELFGFYERLFDRLSGCTTFDAYMHVQARINLEGLLARVDSSTMAASVEARVPFTDHRLVEYLFTLPDALKMKWRDAAAEARAGEMNVAEMDRHGLIQSKVLLRTAFRGEVPFSVLARPKMSFPVPIWDLLGTSLRQTAVEVLSGTTLRDTVFSGKVLDRLVQSMDQPQSAHLLWPVVNLCMWQTACGATLEG
jgi:asparagine synthase (glutamine-hydrolysing)